jgi:PAS domain S-box-containing protein
VSVASATSAEHPFSQRSEYGDVFMSLFERSGIGLAILDPRLRVLETNTAFYQQFGRLSSDVRERNFAELLHPSIRPHLLRQFARLAQGHARFVERVVAPWASGPAFSGELTGIAVDDEAGQVKTIVVLVKPENTDRDSQIPVGSRKTLTSMDARILEGVAAGIPTVQLAAKLYLSRQGVEYHVSTMMRKFMVPNRAALASKAYSMGIFSAGCWPPKVLPDYVSQ